MKIDKTKHKELMLKILADIADEPVLAMNLGFKGGTACYFLYGLDRFSVDLDFDLLDVSKRDEVLGKIDSILKKYGIVKMGGNVFSRKLKYSEDASLFHIMPSLIVAPEDVQDLQRLVNYAREHNLNLCTIRNLTRVFVLLFYWSNFHKLPD